MAKNYLDSTGLDYFYSKIKPYLNSYYGECETGATTAIKVVTCPNFKLETGAMIRVKFANAQDYSSTVKLNVNNTGEISVYKTNGSPSIRYYWTAGEVVDFVYDGSKFIMEGKGTATTTYYGLTKLTTSAASSDTSTALTPASLDRAMQYIATGYALYSKDNAYSVGARVRYGNYVYECITAINTPEYFNTKKWKIVDPLQTQINGKEDAKNKVSSISSSSTNDQYPSAKAVYDLFNSITNGDEVSY